MQRVLQTIERVAGAAGALGAVLLAATGAMLTYEVVARYFFTAPTIWAAELSQLCLIWGCMLAAAKVLADGRHITVTAITQTLPERAQRLCAGAALIWLFVFCAICALYGFDIFWDSFTRGRTTGSLLNLPTWVAELAIPVGCALLCLQAVVELRKLAAR